MVPRFFAMRSEMAWKGLITYDGVLLPDPPPVIMVPLSVFHPKFTS